jgi:hypothetical protein
MTLNDPSGSIQGTMSKHVIVDNKEWEDKINIGSVLILEKV